MRGLQLGSRIIGRVVVGEIWNHEGALGPLDWPAAWLRLSTARGRAECFRLRGQAARRRLTPVLADAAAA
jgi:hypothetical protein